MATQWAIYQEVHKSITVNKPKPAPVFTFHPNPNFEADIHKSLILNQKKMKTIYSSLVKPPQIVNSSALSPHNTKTLFNSKTHFIQIANKYSLKFNSLRIRAIMAKEEAGQSSTIVEMANLLFVEMGVGYDQHGQDVTAAAMRACRDAISSNSIPAFRRGSIPGVSFEQMKLKIKLGVPKSLQHSLDIEKVKSVFPYGKILDVEVVDGGLICSSGVHVEEMGDKNDDCYIVNAAVYVGY